MAGDWGDRTRQGGGDDGEDRAGGGDSFCQLSGELDHAVLFILAE
jgi:hypothetical protein